MKYRLFTSLLSVILILSLFGCSAPQKESDAKPLFDGKKLKLLAITSSFGVNTTEYLYDIATAEGVEDIVIGRLYFGACTLQRHVRYAKEDTPDYTYYKNTAGQWVTKENVPMSEGLTDEDWDIIFIQQSAAKAAIPESYEDYVAQLIDHINRNKTNPDAKIIWNMTWAYQSDSTQEVFVKNFESDQDAMYRKIVETVQEKVIPHKEIVAIVPSGTAIQNVRTSYFGDRLTEDTYHLNAYGKIVAGYTLFATLKGGPLAALNLKTVDKWITLSELNQAAFLEAVNNAIATPYTVTPSTHTG